MADAHPQNEKSLKFSSYGCVQVNIECGDLTQAKGQGQADGILFLLNREREIDVWKTLNDKWKIYKRIDE